MNDPKWKSEFDAFQNAAPTSPPREISESILSRVAQSLHPSPWKVFSKLSLIHLGSALITLSVCPQFGFRTIGEGMGLMHYFMNLGPYACEIACGAFFLGTSLLFAMMLLSIEEVRALRNHRLTEIGALVLLSLGAFIMLDAGSVIFSFAMMWALGSFIGAQLVLELGWKLKQKIALI